MLETSWVIMISNGLIVFGYDKNTILTYFTGLLFLSLDPKTINGITRVLLSTDEEEYNYMPTLQNYLMSPELAEQCSPFNLGLLLVFHLQSLQHIDQLLHDIKPGIY